MNNMSTDVQVWFLRHGKTSFNYEDSTYDDFIEMLCDGFSTPLVEKDDPGIHLKSLPQQVDLVCYSPFRRAFETAQVLRSQLHVKSMEEQEFLREVGFDRDIILPNEYVSLAENRKDILERWFEGKNTTETFEASLQRAREIESFIGKQQVKTIILVTHGWFLRLLEVYFVQGKHADITLHDILKTDPVPLGHSFNATVARKLPVESQMDFVEGRHSRQPRARATRSLSTDTTGRSSKIS
jgi:broad specificity phosphatase PhoE